MFPCDFCKIFWNTFLWNTYGQLLFLNFLARRSGDIVALPGLSTLPQSGTTTYLVPGVNCQVVLKDKTIDGSNKRVIERSTCAEGWTMEAALLKFFGGAGQDLETESGGNKF